MTTTSTPSFELFARADLIGIESNTVRDRLAASKRYKGRANDIRALAKLDAEYAAITEAALDAREAERAAAAHEDELVPLFPDAPFTGDEETARTETLARLEEAFRSRVATRAYYMALNGQGRDDVDRWLYAEQLQRAAEAKPVPFTCHAGLDYYDENAYRH